MLCIKFNYSSDKMITHVNQLISDGDAWGDINNPKHVFISCTSPNGYLKTAVKPEWFESHKAELGYW